VKGRYAYETRWKYPHMLGEDVPVWERFIRCFPDRFESVDYDWRVGEGTEPPADFEGSMWRMAVMISQKRIDVVGWNGDAPTIIEVKDRASSATAGQIEGYRILWRRDFPNFGYPAVLVVCGRISQDDRVVLRARGIPLEVV